MVPHLTTALAGPLLDLERRILERMPEIELEDLERQAPAETVAA